jgi:hypothetical protein
MVVEYEGPWHNQTVLDHFNIGIQMVIGLVCFICWALNENSYGNVYSFRVWITDLQMIDALAQVLYSDHTSTFYVLNTRQKFQVQFLDGHCTTVNIRKPD